MFQFPSLEKTTIFPEYFKKILAITTLMVEPHLSGNSSFKIEYNLKTTIL